MICFPSRGRDVAHCGAVVPKPVVPMKTFFSLLVGVFLALGVAQADDRYEIWVDLELDAGGKPTNAYVGAMMSAPAKDALLAAVMDWTYQDAGGDWSGLPSTSAVLVEMRSVKTETGYALEFEKLYEGPRPVSVMPLPLEPGIAPAHEEIVYLAFTVARNGFARAFRVIKGGSRPEYERAAVESLREWKWEPRRVNGKKVSYRVESFPVVILAR